MTGLHSQLLLKWSKQIDLVAKVQGLIFGVCFVACFAYPVVLYLSTGERGYIVLCFLPYFDIYSIEGFILNNVYQSILGIISLCTMYPVDLLIINLLFTGAAYVDTVRHDCVILSNEIRRTNGQKMESYTELLRTVVIRGQETIKY